jgi:H+-transporting ATPase
MVNKNSFFRGDQLTLKEETQNLPSTNLTSGLSSDEAKKRIAEYGYNEIPEKTVNFWKVLGKRFWGIVPWMLEAIMVITIVLGKYVQAAIIVVLLF